MKPAKKHVAIYVRVSSTSQNGNGQEVDLQRWADSQDQPYEFYRDKFTGKTMERPGFSQIERAIAAGQVSTLVCWRLDRLGRTAKGLATLFEDLQARKVNLVSLKENLDLSTSSGRLLAHVLASVAAFETEVRSERQLAGIAAAKAEGKHLGRPVGSKHSRIPPEKRRAVFEHQAAGWKVADIAAAVGLARKTVYAVLKEQSA